MFDVDFVVGVYVYVVYVGYGQELVVECFVDVYVGYGDDVMDVGGYDVYVGMNYGSDLYVVVCDMGCCFLVVFVFVILVFVWLFMGGLIELLLVLFGLCENVWLFLLVIGVVLYLGWLFFSVVIWFL